MAIIKCKMCGGDLTLTEGKSVAECEYCGSRQTVPAADNEKKLTLFARANRLRAACEFDSAAAVYESIVADFPEEAEAYWGLVLCKYGIEYVDDPATGKKIPTCHRSSYESVLEDKNFEQALENAEIEALRVYREEAKQMEKLREGILAVSSQEEPYDIFICYKETDENGDRTLDSVLAQDLYSALTDKGYRVFFSRVTLRDKLGEAYEPYIFAALHSAKVMLAIGSQYEYYNAVWVKNEWSRYLKICAADKSKHLIPCYKDIDAYDMPREFKPLQAVNLGQMGAVQDILFNMERYIPRKDAAAVQETQKAGGLSEQISELIDRAYKAFENKQWEEADELFEKILDTGIDTPDHFIIEQNIKQSRETAQFHIRRKKYRKHNLILAAVILIIEVFLFTKGNGILSGMMNAVADAAGSYETAKVILTALPFGASGLLILSSVLGASFVGKRAGHKSFWAGLARVLSIIGLILSCGLIWLFQTQISQISSTDKYLVTTVCDWLKNVAAIHFVAFVLLFFRKKI